MTLVIHHGALGDFVLIFPILRACREAGESLHLAARSGHVRLAEMMFPGLTGENIDAAAWAAMFGAAPTSAIAPAIRSTLGRARQILCFASNGRDALAAHLENLVPQARKYFVQPRPPVDWTSHVTAWHQRQLQAQGWNPPVAPMQTYPLKPGPSGSDVMPDQPVQGRDISRVVLHPGSGGRDKCWPRERFEKLMETLTADGLRVQPLLGEVELERWPGGAVRQWQDRWRARVCMDMRELYEHLRQARLFMGNDSGPTHLAAQMGVPTLALFGPTDARVWAPAGRCVRVLAPVEPVDMGWLEVAVVRQALAELMRWGV